VEAVRVSAEGVVAAAAGLDSDARPFSLAWISGEVDLRSFLSAFQESGCSNHEDAVPAQQECCARCHETTPCAPAEGGGLSIGQLEPEARLRWRGARIGDTPLHAALFPSSRTLLLATQSLDGLCWLRLLHATSLRQVCCTRCHGLALPASSLPLVINRICTTISADAHPSSVNTGG